MILFTVGSTEQPFDRLVRAAAALEGDEPLLVQYGSSSVTHGPGEWIDFLSFDDLAQVAEQARAVVCHAGVGSIMLARRFGHRAIVVPRRHHLGEAVDDHQLALAQRLAVSGMVTLVEDERSLPAALAAPDAVEVTAREVLQGPGALTADVRSLLVGLGARRISARAA